MPITGRFIADFGSFSDAVKKATADLKGMETDANKVGTSLNRMVDQFSGRKVIQESQLMVQAFELLAQKGIGLTTKELQRMGDVAEEAMAKLKAGGEQIPPGLQKIADAAVESRKKLEEQNKAAEGGALSFGKLFSSFTAANLAATAIQKLTGSVAELIDRGQKLPGIESSFERLSKSIGQDSAAMVATLQGATKGLVGEMELMQTANKAMLLGLPVTVESMGEMAQAATKLGLAMGKDATSSIDDMITGLARMSPQILDNLGLTVKLGEANEDYARKVGKTAEQLTEAEQKTAFYEKAMEAARTKSKELGDQSLTLGQILQSVWVTALDHATRYAAFINKEGGKLLAAPSGGPSGRDSGIADQAAANRAAIIAKQMDDMARSGGAVAEAWGKVKGEIKLTAMNAADLDVVYKELDRVFKSTGKTIAENAAAAEKLDQAMVKAATAGAKAFKDFHAGIENVNHQMTLFVSKHLKEMGEQGQKVLSMTGEAAVKFGLDMSGLHPVIAGLSKDFMDFTATGIQAARNLPPEIKKSTDALAELSQSLTQLATVSAGTFGTMVSSLASLVVGAKTARDSIASIKDAAKSTDKFESILGMTSGILGLVTVAMQAANAIKGIWNAIAGRGGRHAVEDFAESFGGFDKLHAKLAELGDEGDRLWKSLTQGVGANNPAEAARVIAEVEAALAKQAEAQGDVTSATEEQAQATIETASQATKALEELGPKIKTNEDEWRGWGDVVTAQIQRIADAVRALSLPTMPGAAAIGAGAGGGSMAFSNKTTLILDGEVVGETVARQIMKA